MPRQPNKLFLRSHQAFGNERTNSVPLPGTLLTEIFPLRLSTIFLTKESPMPLPGIFFFGRRGSETAVKYLGQLFGPDTDAGIHNSKNYLVLKGIKVEKHATAVFSIFN